MVSWSMRHLYILLMTVGCGQVAVDDTPADAPNWAADVAPIIQTHCVSCHQDGDIAPFPLTTYDQVVAVDALVRASVDEGTMPPWQPADGCRDYHGDTSMSEAERATLLDWIDGGSQQGESGLDLTVEPKPPVQPLAVSLQMNDAYTPRQSPDDYRCFVIEWPETEPPYIVRAQVRPGTLSQVHHVLAYKGNAEDADQFRAWDDAEEGEGYTCFGAATGPGGGVSTGLLGGWVPGIVTQPYPEGTGLFIEPGAVIILQMHYNTVAGASIPDDTSISFDTAATVEHEAVSSLFTNALWTLGDGMWIPAGDASVVHAADIDVGGFLRINGSGFEVGADETLELHTVGMHMHQLGRRATVSLIKADGTEQCLLDIPRWDFNWQGRYQLAETVLVEPGDKIHLKCEWDNSAEAQPTVDGVKLAPKDTFWGDGTRDEMCLSGMYLSRR
ncbi:MAG: monooxygenase [Rhodobacterales bacterium]|nr:monooxygenase [Rhodobacterales bacterium]